MVDHKSWASGTAEIAEPTQERIVSGWVAEKPSHKLFNWWMNRADNRIKALEEEVELLRAQLSDVLERLA